MHLSLNNGRPGLAIIASAIGHALLMTCIMWFGDPRHNPEPLQDLSAEQVTRVAPQLAILYIPPAPRPVEAPSSKGNAETGDAALEKVRVEAPPKPEPKPQVKPRRKPAAKKTPRPEPKPEVKPEPKPEVKPEPKPEVKPDREVAPVVATTEPSKATTAAAAPPVVAAAPVSDGQTIGSAQAPATTSSAGDAASPGEATSAGSSNPSRAGARDGDADLKTLRRGYRKRVFHQLNRDKVYPALARRARMQGKVVLGIHIDGAGRILKVEVVRSSGHQVLDREAQLAVQRLGKLPTPPESLGWDRKVLRVPMIYRLT